MRVQGLLALPTLSAVILQLVAELGKLALLVVATDDVNPPQITLFPPVQLTN